MKDKDWKYTTAAESAKPGYLQRKFARIRAEQKIVQETAEAKIKPINSSRKIGIAK